MISGEPLTTAMERIAVRVPVPAVVRFVDGLVVAVARGTPLGDVLRAQAADVREQHKRDLIEAKYWPSGIRRAHHGPVAGVRAHLGPAAEWVDRKAASRTAGRLCVILGGDPLHSPESVSILSAMRAV